MTIQLGSPTMQKKKRIIGYWTSDDENVKLEVMSIDTDGHTCIWAEPGAFNGKFMLLHIIELDSVASGKIEYDISVISELEEWSDHITSESKLEEFDVAVKLEDGEHSFKIKKTR